MTQVASAQANKSGDEKSTLEFWKLAQSAVGQLLVAASIIFAGLQWRTANQIADQAVYQQLVKDWKEHLQNFINHPNLWPYFEEGKLLQPGDESRDLVFSLAEVRLQAMDAVLANIRLRWNPDSYPQWNTTFEREFRNSPVLCSWFRKTSSEWEDVLQDIAKRSCAPEPALPKN
jgi:hypothetical protein